jgi:hypothetical protein
MAKSDKQILDIETINIFNHPRYMKVWAQRFSKACGSDTFNVAPDTIALRYLMDKFVKDYNFHLAELEEE